VYGTALKEAIGELAGAGILSAADFRLGVQRPEGPRTAKPP
jgi:cyanate lyase